MNHKLKDDAAQFLVDYPGYYMTKRGYHPRAVNSGNLLLSYEDLIVDFAICMMNLLSSRCIIYRNESHE
ncbi:hypothetical protein DMH20_06195 [Escherichia coli]|nr:hypothetical protein [Escherichia coli]